MTTEARAALRDKAIERHRLNPGTELVDAVIAVALEEAAKVAETPIEVTCCNNPNWSGNPKDQPECCCNPEYRWGDPGEIAAAIRALISKETT